MKKLFFILFSTLSIALGAQNAPALVNTLNAQNQIAEVISNEPSTGLERYVTAHTAQWRINSQEIKVYFQIHVLNAQGQEIKAFESRYTTTASNVNKVDPSTGADIPASDTSSARIGEYTFLYEAVEADQLNIIEMLRAQITKLDQEGKFD